jgi:hypothetical protein
MDKSWWIGDWQMNDLAKYLGYYTLILLFVIGSASLLPRIGAWLRGGKVAYASDMSRKFLLDVLFYALLAVLLISSAWAVLTVRAPANKGKEKPPRSRLEPPGGSGSNSRLDAPRT